MSAGAMTKTLFDDPEVVAALEAIEAAEPPDRLAAIERARQLIDVPENGVELRAWLRYNLQRVPNKKTGKPWNQADVGREAGDASGATVSRVFVGELPSGKTSDKVRQLTADILGIPVDVIWKPAEVCPACGNPLSPGDLDT